MTRNQIEYWKLGEEARHNQASEGETARHNVTTEKETERSNRAREGIDLSKLAETTRHNVVTEGETRRHNVATEDETNRHNVVTESVDLGKLGESVRHNKAAEALSGANVNLGYAELSEQAKHNRNTETIQKYSAVSQDVLNKSRAGLAEVQAAWEPFNNITRSDLSAAQKAQINAQIDKLSREVDRLQQNMDWNTYDKVLNGLDTAAKVMSSLDDLQRAISGFRKDFGKSSEQKYSDYLDQLLEDIRNEN